MSVHLYLRRSKNDEGKQQFSLDVQRAGCMEFLRGLPVARRSIAEYVDDGKSGDDFHSRAALRKLIASVKPGDTIVCRDQSRLGRDAIEVTLVIRDLVRDRGCHLFYYSTGQEVQFSNAIDQATTFIQGTGHQMELEAIRSRTKEALRSRVRQGRIAGGRCYGYRLERRTDTDGRSYTAAVIVPEQAAIITRIYTEYLAHRGLKAIAIGLNNEGVPPPMAGRRGTGSWSHGAIRVMLMNARYRGVYVHGKVKKVRRAGGVERVKADASEVLTVDIPEWRIVDDETWFAVQERFTGRTGPTRQRHSTARYALSGIARCGTCSGPINVTRSTHGKERFQAYGCAYHRQRGPAVCPVTVHQRLEDVEGTLVDVVQREVLNAEVEHRLVMEIRRQVERQMPRATGGIAEMEEELATMRSEQKRLAKAVSMTDDVPELLTELQRRNARIRVLDAQIAATKRSPAETAALIAKAEDATRAKVDDLRAALRDPEERRRVFHAMFPTGIRLHPDRIGKRNVWRIEAVASLEELGSSYGKLRCDPGGNWALVEGEIARLYLHLLGRPTAKYARTPSIRSRWRRCDRVVIVAAICRRDLCGAISTSREVGLTRRGVNRGASLRQRLRDGTTPHQENVRHRGRRWSTAPQ